MEIEQMEIDVKECRAKLVDDIVWFLIKNGKWWDEYDGIYVALRYEKYYFRWTIRNEYKIISFSPQLTIDWYDIEQFNIKELKEIIEFLRTTPIEEMNEYACKESDNDD